MSLLTCSGKLLLNDNCSETEQATASTYSYFRYSGKCDKVGKHKRKYTIHKNIHHTSYSLDSHAHEKEHLTNIIPQLDGCDSLSSLSDPSVCDLSLSSSFCASDDSSGKLTYLDNSTLMSNTHLLSPIQQLDGNDSFSTSDGASSDTDTSEDEQCEDQFSIYPRMFARFTRNLMILSTSLYIIESR